MSTVDIGVGIDAVGGGPRTTVVDASTFETGVSVDLSAYLRPGTRYVYPQTVTSYAGSVEITWVFDSYTDATPTFTGILLEGASTRVAFETEPVPVDLSYFSGAITFTTSGGATGQYADGSYWTTGAITAMTPAFETGVTRTLEDLSTVANTEVHGFRVNPGKAASGTTLGEKQAVNHGVAAPQAYDSLVIGQASPYDAALRPTLPISGQASVVKAKSQLTGIDLSGRPVLTHMAVCTIAPTAPPAGSLRPPLARADKTPILNTADIDLDKLENFDATGIAVPAYADAMAFLSALLPRDMTFGSNDRSVVGVNDAVAADVTYAGSVAKTMSSVLLGMHFDAWTTEQKTQIAIRLGLWAQDIAARVYEGGVFQDAGGLSHGHLPVLAFTAELFDSDYLRDACALLTETDQAGASIKSPLGVSVFGDVTQLGYVTQAHIDLGAPPVNGSEIVPAWPQTALGWPGWGDAFTRSAQPLYNILGHIITRPATYTEVENQAPYQHIAGTSKPAEALAVRLIGADGLVPQVWLDYADRYAGWWVDGADERYATQPNANLRSTAGSIWAPQDWAIAAWGRHRADAGAAWGGTVGPFTPAAMVAPSLAAQSSSEIDVTRGAEPNDRGFAITSYDLRYSTDETNWTTMTGIASVQAVTGLTASTLYYVQTRAVNAIGAGDWSPSASVTTPAAFSFAPRSASFDGATSQLYDAGLSVTAGSEGTLSVWFYHDGTWNTPAGVRLCTLRNTAGTTIFDLYTTTSGRLAAAIAGAPGGLVTGTSTFLAGRWNHVLMSWKAGSGGWWKLSANGATPIDGADLTSATLTIASGIGRAGIGSNAASASYWPGDLGHFYINVTEALDITVQANREKFILAGEPVNLGEHGQIPTGTAPAFYFDGDAATGLWNNKGTGPELVITAPVTAGGAPALP